MDSDMLSQQLVAMRRRVASLYQAAPRSDNAEVLSKAFEELQYALDQLLLAEELLRRQQQELHSARDAQEQERQHTIDTFNWVPVAYIVTGLDGTIKRVNQAATCFLNQTEKFLLGKSLGLFIPEGGRRAFRNELGNLVALSHPDERLMRLQPTGSRPLDVCVTVGAARDSTGRAISLHWLLRRAESNRGRASARLESFAGS